MRVAISMAATLLIALTAGCASTLPTLSELRPVPASRAPQASQSLARDAATLTVLRDKAFAGGLVNYELLLDGALIARIGTGEYVAVLVAPGEHVLELRHPSETLGTPGDSQSWRAEPAGDYYFRINSDIGLMRLVRTTRASALGDR